MMIAKSTEPRRGVPLRPAWDEYERPPCLARAALACVRHAFEPGRYSGAEEIARRTWPDDQVTRAIVTRATSSPATSTNTAALVQSAVGEFLASLAPTSAAASLFATAPRIQLGRTASITFPRRAGAIDASAVSWVDESSPARVPRLNVVAGAQLGPMKKLAAIVACTRELAEASSADDALDLLLRESASLALDVSVFSTTAATTAQPAGILAGVAGLTPSTATPKDAAIDDDLASLSEAIAAATTGLVYVGHPAQINSIKVRRGTQWSPDIPLWSTTGIAPGTIVALDPQGIASAFGPEPEIRTLKEASVVFDDSVPGAIINSGQPAGSLFQSDSLALQLRLRAAWCVRVPGCIAWMSGTNW